MSPWSILGGALAMLALCAGCALMGVKYADRGWQARWDNAVVAAQAQAQKDQQAQAAAIAAVTASQTQTVADYEQKLADANAKFAAAVRLYNDANTARAKLQAAAAAPAECGSYAASPTQLSSADAGVLIRIATAGDDAIYQLQACQSEYSQAISSYNALITKFNARN